MQVQIITPEKTIFSGEAVMVTAPGVDGDFGVLVNHAPFISALRAGTVTIEQPGGKQQSIDITGGFAEVTPERCALLINGLAGHAA